MIKVAWAELRHLGAMSLGDVVVIAHGMVSDFGPGAAPVMEARAVGHMRAGDPAGAEFWSEIAEAVRRLGGGGRR